MIKHKFKNKITELDGIKFRSKKEADYYVNLKTLQKAGHVLFFTMQTPFHLPGNTKYVCDFVEYWNNGEVRFVDVKGMRTPTYVLKKKQVEALYPILITEF